MEGMTYADSLAWISFDANPTSNRDGTIDMGAHGTWLKANYGITLQ